MRVYSIVYWSVLKLEKFPGTGCLCISLVRSVKSRPYLLLSLPRFYSLFSPLHLFTACGCPPEGVGMGLKYSLSPIYWSVCPPEEGALGVPRWPSRVKIWCCPCCGSGLIPGCRISTCCGYGQKKKGLFFFLALLGPRVVTGHGPDPSRSCNLGCSYGSAGSFNPLRHAGDWTCVLTWPLCPGAAEAPLIMLRRRFLKICV